MLIKDQKNHIKNQKNHIKTKRSNRCKTFSFQHLLTTDVSYLPWFSLCPQCEAANTFAVEHKEASVIVELI